MKKSGFSQVFYLFIIAVLFIFNVSLIYLYFFSQRPSTSNSAPVVIPVETVVPSVDPLLVWNTYADTQEGFTFNYPSTYFADNKDISRDLFVVLKGSDYKLVSNDFGDKYTGSFYNFGLNIVCEPSDIVGDGQIMYSAPNYTVYAINGYEGPNYKSAIFFNKGACFEMTCNSDTGCDGKQLAEFKQILSTFKFTQ